MLLSFPVPPFKRQAARPLIENLPNVLVSGLDIVGDELSSGTPSPRGMQRRLCSRVLALHLVLRLPATTQPAARFETRLAETQRGHCAQATKSRNRGQQ